MPRKRGVILRLYKKRIILPLCLMYKPLFSFQLRSDQGAIYITTISRLKAWAALALRPFAFIRLLVLLCGILHLHLAVLVAFAVESYPLSLCDCYILALQQTIS